jgi:hypothetical protein
LSYPLLEEEVGNIVTQIQNPVFIARENGVSQTNSPRFSTRVVPQQQHVRPDRSGSWTLPAPAGAYGPVVAWNSPGAWFDALLDVLATTEGEELRRLAKVASRTLLRVAVADREVADKLTGRGVATANETVALQLGVCAKTVQRARTLLERLGFAVTIVEGRYLTRSERQAARSVHGGNQLRAASLRALTIPKPSVDVRNVQLPRRGEAFKSSSVKTLEPKRASARKSDASRPPAMMKLINKNKNRRVSPVSQAPRSFQMQQLAAKVALKFPGVLGNRHIGALCDVLQRAGIVPELWRADPLSDVVHRHIGTFPDLATKRDPLAYFGWILRQAINPAELTPVQKEHQAQAARDAERDRRAAEQAEDERRMAAADMEEIARIIAESNREIAERNRQKRYSQGRP